MTARSDVALPTVSIPSEEGGSDSGRIVLAADATYYVNSDTGSDANAGTNAAPFLTIQHAVNLVCYGLDLGNYRATIQLQDCSPFEEEVELGDYVGGYLDPADQLEPPVKIKGNVADPTQTAVIGNLVYYCFEQRFGRPWKYESIKIGGNSYYGIYNSGSVSILKNVVWGITADILLIGAYDGAFIYSSGNTTFYGTDLAQFADVKQGSYVQWNSQITFNAATVLNGNFINVYNNGYMSYTPGAYTGAVTGGTKFQLLYGGTLTVASTLPGDTAGTRDGSSVFNKTGFQTAGSVTLVAGTKDVTTGAATATALVSLTRKTAGGAIGDLSYTVTADTKITINSANAGDTSVVSWVITEPIST